MGIAAGLSQEAELLLLLAGPTGNHPRIRELLASDLNWPLLHSLAMREKALPALWNALQNSPSVSISEEERKRMGQLVLVGGFRQEHLQQRFLKVLDLLAERGTETILLKGAALVATVYESFEQRPMADVDILLRRDEAWHAQQVLVAAGWEEEYTRAQDAAYREHRKQFYEEHHHLPVLIDVRGTGIAVELHVGLLPTENPFAFPTAAVWRDARSASFRGRTVRVPSVNHLLLHCCLHFAWSHTMHHGAWRTFRDILSLTSAEKVDWLEFEQLARSARAASCCYWTFELGRALAGLEFPSGLLEELQPPVPASLRRRISHHLAHELLPSETICPSVTVRRKMWEIAIRPGWSGHGALRPWLSSDGTALYDRTSSKGAGKLRLHLQRFGKWRTYIGAMLVPNRKRAGALLEANRV